MSIFRDFFVKQKPVFTGITRGVGGFGFGKAAGGGEEAAFSLSGGSVNPSGLEPGNGYVYHTFTGPGTLTANAPGNVELFLIGGGGAGGGGYGGGGGAGALIYRTSVPVTAVPLLAVMIPVTSTPLLDVTIPSESMLVTSS